MSGIDVLAAQAMDCSKHRHVHIVFFLHVLVEVPVRSC